MSTHADLARTRTPRRGQNRQPAPRMELFKIPVSVPPDVHEFRADISSHARWLPPAMASVLIGCAVIADAGGEYATTTYEAISAATHTPGIQKRYKCKPVSPRQAERYMSELHELGLLHYYSEYRHVDWWSDDYGQIRQRLQLRFDLEDITNLYELARKLQHEKAEHETGRKESRAAYEQSRNERRKAERARNTAVACDFGEGSYSRPTQTGGTAGGTGGGTAGGSIVPTLSFVTDPLSSSSGPGEARDDEVSSLAENRRGQAPRTPRTQDSGRASSDYGAAVCRALSEHLADPLDPSMFPAAARDLLHRLWPDPQGILAREIAYGHLEDSWQASDGAVSDKVRNEAAVLVNRLRTADEALVRFWVERGTQRLAAMEADAVAKREREAQDAAWQEKIDALRAKVIEAGVPEDKAGSRMANWSHLAPDVLVGKLETWLDHLRAKAEFDRLRPGLTELVVRYHDGEPGFNVNTTVCNELREGDTKDSHELLARLHQKIKWYTDELAARAARVPLAERVLEYVTAHPGLRHRDIADALGTDPEEVWGAIGDLAYRYPKRIRSGRGQYYAIED